MRAPRAERAWSDEFGCVSHTHSTQAAVLGAVGLLTVSFRFGWVRIVLHSLTLSVYPCRE